MKMICSVGGSDIIEERDTLDRTPLIIAAMGGHGELMNHLLSLGGEHFLLVRNWSQGDKLILKCEST